MSSAFIDLHRRFFELRIPGSSSKLGDEDQLVRSGRSFAWDELLAKHRVVILAEAGAGKTMEIRHAAERLRREGKAAFFLRLEHVAAAGLDVAFEVGDPTEFRSWLDSSLEGWLLLDSIDESKLRHPSDFGLAIKKVAVALGSAKDRCHITITGRTPAWRPSSDRSICVSALPMRPIGLQPRPPKEGEMPQPEGDNEGFLVVALQDLSPAQVKAYVVGKGLEGSDGFVRALERDDAWPHAARPLDLDELLQFWRETGRIGSRLELTRDSIERRLRERDPDRGVLSALTADRARDGAMQAAAACTLTGQSAIKVPDAGGGLAGLSLEELLPDWGQHDCMTLLSRAIFDEAIYGCVRIAHRSFREYLTAEWFAKLLAASTSRRSIEQLFIREQFGVTVVVRSLRPILPWLALLDSKIADRLIRIEPEVLLEGGDPRELPLPMRQRLLQECCDRLARGSVTQTSFEMDSIERFSAPDIAADVKRLLAEHHQNPELVVFLLRMVWRGQLTAALPDVLRIATDAAAEPRTRITAMRVLGELGSAADKRELRSTVLKEPAPRDREFVNELLQGSEASEDVLDWLADCLPGLVPPPRHAVDYLEHSVQEFAQRADSGLLPRFVSVVDHFMRQAPYREDRPVPVSQEFAWLARAAGTALERLIVARHPAALSDASLDLLQGLGALSGSSSDSRKSELPKLVFDWRELKFVLFWRIVERARQDALARGEPVPTTWWSYGLYESFVKFEQSDFPHVLGQLALRESAADKSVGLSLACRLYLERGRDPKDRKALWDAVGTNAVLGTDLRAFMHPRVTPAEAKLRRMNREHAKRTKAQREKEKRNFEKSREYLQSHVESLRNSPLASRGQVSSAQGYLLDHVGSKESRSGHWSTGNWRAVADSFGDEVAAAFRDGAIAFWRNHRPVLRSEGALANSTPLSVVFGLFGLAVESTEHPHWVAGLSEADAEIAVRYAIHELNGFPPWLPSVFRRFPEVVLELFMQEIDFELGDERACDREPSSYVLYDVSWSGEWICDRIAPRLYDLVQSSEPQRRETIEQIQKVLQASSLPDAALADLAAHKATSLMECTRVAQWAAVWVGADAAAALGWVRSRLEQLEAGDARQFLMTLLVGLIGARGSRVSARTTFTTPAHLKELYLLAHRYLLAAEDIDRTNSGVYPPGLRDYAQEAREKLLELLFATEGKEAFVAYNEIAESHPHAEWRPWLRVRARKKAELDANDPNWTIANVREFTRDQLRTPSTPRHVFELAAHRMLAFKDEVEEGDNSSAAVLISADQESVVRTFIAGWLRDRAAGRYSLAQEDELADAKRPDIRWYAPHIDAPVPMELKLADNWSGFELFERFENQLCGDYVRDYRTRFGIFVLVWRGEKKGWELPGVTSRVDFGGLVAALRGRWHAISPLRAEVDDVAVIGIDLTKRGRPPSGRALQAVGARS